MTDPVPTPVAENKWCVIHGKGTAAEFIEGGFDTQEEAQANADEDLKRFPDITVEVAVLYNPANC